MTIANDNYPINFKHLFFISDEEKAEMIQRRIIVHSVLYYELNENVISDAEYDCLCKQYLHYANKCNITTTYYYYVFYDFDGTTGFDLHYRLKEYDKKYLFIIAKNVLKAYKGDKGHVKNKK